MKVESDNSSSYIRSIDFLRSLAILLVLYWHYVICGISDNSSSLVLKMVKKTGSWTWSGVDLFFVISGFLIGRILIINKGKKFFFKTFYIKRFLRIFPLYYLVVLSYFVIANNFDVGTKHWLFQKEFASWVYLLFLQNFYIAEYGFLSNWLNVTWSLAVEEQFYLLLPFLVFLLPKKRIALLSLLGFFLAFYYRLTNTGIGSYVLLVARMDALLIGVLIASLYLKYPKLKISLTTRLVIKVVPLVLFISLVCLCLFTEQNYNGGAWIHLVLTSFYAGLLLNTVYGYYDIIWRYFDNKVIVSIAKYSYCIYLIHQIVSGALHGWVLNSHPHFDNYKSISVTILSLFVTYFVAALSYRYFEKPLLRIGKKYNYQ